MECRDLYKRILNSYPLERRTIQVYNKKYTPSRQVVAYGDPGLKYTFSGTTMEAHPWTPELLAVKEKVEAVANFYFNFVLINYYPDGMSKIGPHKDKERDLLPKAPIACLSLGARRTVCFRKDKREETKKFELPNGSVYVMKHPTNLYWTHEILQTAKSTGGRISLTFRRIVTGDPVKDHLLYRVVMKDLPSPSVASSVAASVTGSLAAAPPASDLFDDDDDNYCDDSDLSAATSSDSSLECKRQRMSAAPVAEQ